MEDELFNVPEITLSYSHKIKNRPFIKSKEDAHRILKNHFPKDTFHLQESFLVMYLNRANRVLGIYLASTGGINHTIADIRLVLAGAIKSASSNIILAHNHPSCSLKPSDSDIEITAKIKAVAALMNIKILDHLIISPEEDEFYSFADDGLL